MEKNNKARYFFVKIIKKINKKCAVENIINKPAILTPRPSTSGTTIIIIGNREILFCLLFI